MNIWNSPSLKRLLEVDVYSVYYIPSKVKLLDQDQNLFLKLFVYKHVNISFNLQLKMKGKISQIFKRNDCYHKLARILRNQFFFCIHYLGRVIMGHANKTQSELTCAFCFLLWISLYSFMIMVKKIVKNTQNIFLVFIQLVDVQITNSTMAAPCSE